MSRSYTNHAFRKEPVSRETKSSCASVSVCAETPCLIKCSKDRDRCCMILKKKEKWNIPATFLLYHVMFHLIKYRRGEFWSCNTPCFRNTGVRSELPLMFACVHITSNVLTGEGEWQVGPRVIYGRGLCRNWKVDVWGKGRQRKLAKHFPRIWQKFSADSFISAFPKIELPSFSATHLCLHVTYIYREHAIME